MGVLAFVLLRAWAVVVITCEEASVTYDERGGYDIHTGKVDAWVAWGNFTNDIEETGWAFLDITTNEQAPDEVQAYAAGLVEGVLTRDLISQHWNNTANGYCTPDASSEYCQKLKEFLDVNFNEYVFTSLKQYSRVDPYWHQVELFIDQLKGLEDGHAGVPQSPEWIVNPFGFLLLQISGDLYDLEPALQPKGEPMSVPRWHGTGTRQGALPLSSAGSCSALVKLLPQNTDVLIAHATWTYYQNMLRLLKTYDFAWHTLMQPDTGQKTVIPGRVMTFSSYPGVLMSGDDFYLLSSGLASIETTIGNSNPDLWKYVQPLGTVTEGIRSQVANRLATSGAEWVETFSEHNSGTYNNEWLVVDYKLFAAGQSLKPGLLTLLDQLPGMVHWEDVTTLLEAQRYWPSYNSPYFKDIFNASGTPAAIARYGDWFTYERTPRALIFRRDQGKVTDVGSMLKLMRYNDYTHDPFSQCNCTPPFTAENAISARSDLNPANGTYPFSTLGHKSHGGIDSKVTSSELFKKLQFLAVSGPTYDTLPPFQWSKADFANTTPHEGHPDLFQFAPVMYEWDLDHE